MEFYNWHFIFVLSALLQIISTNPIDNTQVDIEYYEEEIEVDPDTCQQDGGK